MKYTKPAIGIVSGFLVLGLMSLLSLLLLFHDKTTILEQNMRVADIKTALGQMKERVHGLETSLALEIKTKSAFRVDAETGLSAEARRRLEQWAALKQRLSESAVCNPTLEEKPKQVDFSQFKHPGSAWQYIKALVVVRHWAPDIHDCLALMILKQELLFQCQQAQWALLTHDQTVYQTALSKSISLTKEIFGISVFDKVWKSDWEALHA